MMSPPFILIEPRLSCARRSLNLNEFDRLIDGLRDPDAYEHPVSRVEVLETHISGVLLAGDYAYKIKKPVDFGFVNFSTLEKRRHFCEEELRLNRRFAPELYLDVVPVHGSPDSPSLKPAAGAPIEYAVRMKRFDQDALLDRCIHRNGLVTGGMIESFAADVAAVHQAAAVAAPDSEYGTPEIVSNNVRECWKPIRDAGLFEAGRDVESLVEYMDASAVALGPWFEQRLRRGRVRECHGDLHLGNLFLADERIRVFDCIEFNPALRWIDVANDIAFFTMDLRFHDKAGFARRFRNAYLDATGDRSLLRVLHFYEIYRTLVRAKVAGLREIEEAGSGREDACRHLDLAAYLASGNRSTPLVITYGLSGSGKTFLSSELLAESEAVRIRSDVERRRFVEKGEGRYSSDNIEKVYEHLLGVVQEVIGAGYAVIVDATFLRRPRRDSFRRLAGDLGVPFRILHCSAPDSELRRRIARRARNHADASEADVDVLDQQLDNIEPLDPDEQTVTVRYDSESSPPLSQLLHDLGLDAQP
jgi:hypothetical protein